MRGALTALFLAIVTVATATPGIANRQEARAAYDPLAVGPERPARAEFVVRDAARSREIPILVYLPKATSPAPIVLFSHGLGGSREMGAFLGEHWARRGYVAVFLQHPGSDVDVWQGRPRGQGLASLVAAASAQNFLLRVRDVTAVLDQLGRWQVASGHDLRGRLDMARIGMSGHSFGAITTQAVSGQTFPAGIIAADPRIKAALPMSPSTPQRGSAASAFAAVKIPWLVMTGTLDSSPIGNASAASRRDVFAALRPPSKYELVLDGAEHSAFTDRALPGDKAARNPNHHRTMLALSTAFWDAYLRADDAARTWLDGDGARTVLQPRDLWARK
jgi:predicted dienelactone hydrolase